MPGLYGRAFFMQILRKGRFQLSKRISILFLALALIFTPLPVAAKECASPLVYFMLFDLAYINTLDYVVWLANRLKHRLVRGFTIPTVSSTELRLSRSLDRRWILPRRKLPRLHLFSGYWEIGGSKALMRFWYHETDVIYWKKDGYS